MENNIITAQEVIRSFSTWKYKRENPSDLAKFNMFIQRFIDQDKPIKFFMYWGRGDRIFCGESEERVFNYVDSFLSKIKGVYKNGAELCLVLTDTHAALNGYDDIGTQSYFSSIIVKANERGYKTVFLSQLISYDENALSERVNNTEIDSKMLSLLVESASKHYKTSSNYYYAAKLYFLQNQLEKKVLEKEFSHSIFLTFNGSSLNKLFPEALPIFYMYSFKKGTSIKPWFT